MVKLQINLLKGINTLVIKRIQGLGFFMTSPDSIIISISDFATLLKYLVLKNIISPKILEGILEEYYDETRF